MLNTEIKPCIGRERETGAAVALETQSPVQRAGTCATEPLLSSFSTEALIAARDAAPEFDRAHLFETRCRPTGWRAARPSAPSRSTPTPRTLTPGYRQRSPRQRPARRLPHLQRPGRR